MTVHMNFFIPLHLRHNRLLRQKEVSAMISARLFVGANGPCTDAVLCPPQSMSCNIELCANTKGVTPYHTEREIILLAQICSEGVTV